MVKNISCQHEPIGYNARSKMNPISASLNRYKLLLQSGTPLLDVYDMMKTELGMEANLVNVLVEVLAISKSESRKMVDDLELALFKKNVLPPFEMMKTEGHTPEQVYKEAYERGLSALDRLKVLIWVF